MAGKERPRGHSGSRVPHLAAVPSRIHTRPARSAIREVAVSRVPLQKGLRPRATRTSNVQDGVEPRHDARSRFDAAIDGQSNCGVRTERVRACGAYQRTDGWRSLLHTFFVRPTLSLQACCFPCRLAVPWYFLVAAFLSVTGDLLSLRLQAHLL